MGAPSFPANRPPDPIRHSPFRLNLKRHGGVLWLFELLTILPLFDLVENSFEQFGGLYS